MTVDSDSVVRFLNDEEYLEKNSAAEGAMSAWWNSFTHPSFSRRLFALRNPQASKRPYLFMSCLASGFIITHCMILVSLRSLGNGRWEILDPYLPYSVGIVLVTMSLLLLGRFMKSLFGSYRGCLAALVGLIIGVMLSVTSVFVLELMVLSAPVQIVQLATLYAVEACLGFSCGVCAMGFFIKINKRFNVQDYTWPMVGLMFGLLWFAAIHSLGEGFVNVDGIFHHLSNLGIILVCIAVIVATLLITFIIGLMFFGLNRMLQNLIQKKPSTDT